MAARRGVAAREGAYRKVEQRRDHSHDARHDELLRQEASERDVADEAASDDREGGDPKRQLEPQRPVPSNGLQSPCFARFERRQQQPDEHECKCEAGDERLHDAQRQREIEDLREG